jgi:hypothetical protein
MIFMCALIAVFAGALIFFSIAGRMVKNKTFVIRDGYVPLVMPVTKEKLIFNLKKMRLFSLEEQSYANVYKYRDNRDVIYAVIVNGPPISYENFSAFLDFSEKKKEKRACIVIGFNTENKEEPLLNYINEAPLIIAIADNKHMKLYLPKELNCDRYYRLFLGKAFEGMIEKKKEKRI